jgi:hypothetical protein
MSALRTVWPSFLSLLLPVTLLSSKAVAQSPEAVPAPATSQPASESEPLSAALAKRIVEQGFENSGADKFLRELTGTIGHRLTGSDNFTKACHWARDQFAAAGETCGQR